LLHVQVLQQFPGVCHFLSSNHSHTLVGSGADSSGKEWEVSNWGCPQKNFIQQLQTCSEMWRGK
jgi:hypothetical protein